MADIDVNLEWLTKGIKDVEHSSAMAQHTVHTMFENLYKTLKQKEEEFIREIQQKCMNQLDYMEYEKYRLIETKKYQSELFHNSVCEEDFQSSIIVNNTDLNENETLCNITQNDITCNLLGFRALHLSISSCHIGHQHINFTPCETKMRELDRYLEHLGKVSWEFDLKINLDRDLGKLEEYPCGIEIKGIIKENFEHTLAAPTGNCIFLYLYLSASNFCGLSYCFISFVILNFMNKICLYTHILYIIFLKRFLFIASDNRKVCSRFLYYIIYYLLIDISIHTLTKIIFVPMTRCVIF